MQCIGKGLNCGKTIFGCCSMTVLQLVHHSSSTVICHNIDISCPLQTLLSRLSPNKLFPFSKLKTALKGYHFQTIGEIRENEIREPSQKVHSSNHRNVGSGVTQVEGIHLKGTALKMMPNDHLCLYSKNSLFFFKAHRAASFLISILFCKYLCMCGQGVITWISPALVTFAFFHSNFIIICF